MTRFYLPFLGVMLCAFCNCAGRAASNGDVRNATSDVPDPLCAGTLRKDSISQADSLRRVRRALQDSLYRIEQVEREQREQEAYHALPFISAEEVEKWKPVAGAWYDFYGMDIRQMKLYSSSAWDFYAERDEGIYYRPFTPADDSNSLELMQYSPDRQRYVDPNICPVFLEDDGINYWYGGDDCIEIYLTDRLAKKKSMILWGGVCVCLDGVFWKDNETFALTGSGYVHCPGYFMKVFDLRKRQTDLYEMLFDPPEDRRSYLTEVFFREEGIVEK